MLAAQRVSPTTLAISPRDVGSHDAFGRLGSDSTGTEAVLHAAQRTNAMSDAGDAFIACQPRGRRLLHRGVSGSSSLNLRRGAEQSPAIHTEASCSGYADQRIPDENTRSPEWTGRHSSATCHTRR